jgi:hypothetical protein
MHGWRSQKMMETVAAMAVWLDGGEEAGVGRGVPYFSI